MVEVCLLDYASYHDFGYKTFISECCVSTRDENNDVSIECLMYGCAYM